MKRLLYQNLILILSVIIALSSCLNTKDKANNLKEKDVALSEEQKYLTLFDIISNINEDTIKVTFEDPSVHREWKLKRKALENAKTTQEEKCAKALNLMTENLSTEYPYLDMRKYSAGDIADMGDKESCTNMQGVARYYVFVVGLKQLPLELRFGMCLPNEWTPDIMNNAMSKITKTVNDMLGPLLEHPPVPLPTDVVPVMKLYMVSPDQWSEDSKESRAAYSVVFGIFAAGLVGLVVWSTIFENIIKSQSRQELPKPQDKNGKESKDGTGLSEKRTIATTAKMNSNNEASNDNPLYGNINYSEGLTNSIFSNEEVLFLYFIFNILLETKIIYLKLLLYQKCLLSNLNNFMKSLY